MRTLRQPSTWVAIATVAGAASYVLGHRVEAGWMPAHDLYAYFYPKALYALASLRNGGQGLLWNPFQNCGQPFFAISQTGLLYPPYLFFLALAPEHALRAVLFLHLAVGGIGAYLLGRELGARPTAAIAGALAFEMGNAMISLTISSPTHCAPYAWMPAALLCSERLLRAPDLRRALSLALILAITLLPGMPQTVFFTYQLIGLRVLWEFATRRVVHPTALLGTLICGLMLPGLLAAVQLLPEIEVARESVRNMVLTAADIYPFGPGKPGVITAAILMRNVAQPLILVPCVVAGAAFCSPTTRRYGLFYGAAGLLYVGLSFGPGTPLFDLYIRIPGGTAFRDPIRFFWVTSFCLAVLTALGCEALTSSWGRRPYTRATAIALMFLPPTLLWLLASRSSEQSQELWAFAPDPSTLSPLFPWGSPTPWEWSAIALVLAAGLGAVVVPRHRAWASGLLLAAIALQLLKGPWVSVLNLLPGPPPFFATQPAFEPIARLPSPQDRVYLLHEREENTQYAFMAKTASLFRLPSVLDYEPLVTRRYAEFSFMLRTGARVRTLNNVLLPGPDLLRSFSRRMLDLTAARYLVVGSPQVQAVERITPPFQRAYTSGDLTVFENPQRLPRAFYVPRVEVVPDAQAILDRLAKGPDDLRQVAFVEETPPSDFTGEPSNAGLAAVRFARNDPEHATLEVGAPARGFLVLSDQYFPGWFASVNGRSAPIQRANYAFRLVEVPAGQSTVEFWYSPRSLWLGAGVSALSLVAVGAMLWWSRRRGS